MVLLVLDLVSGFFGGFDDIGERSCFGFNKVVSSVFALLILTGDGSVCCILICGSSRDRSTNLSEVKPTTE